jgi:archaellum component FlaC
MGGVNKSNTLEKKVDDILDIVIFLKDSIGEQFYSVDQQFHEVRNELGQVNNRLEYMDQDIKEVKQCLTNIEIDVHSLKKQSHEDIDVIVNDVADHEVRIVRLETVNA